MTLVEREKWSQDNLRILRGHRETLSTGHRLINAGRWCAEAVESAEIAYRLGAKTAASLWIAYSKEIAPSKT